MDLLQSFRDFIVKENLFSPGDRLLVAVSGGMDSVVLCELCQQAGIAFRMAHGNFQLRGEESERDEQFVRALALRYGRELFLRRFDTEGYAADQKVSLQVAARELRYAWFREINVQTTDTLPGCILTAHHLDDNIETLLMNFFKGTGMAGLHGILPRQGDLVRPLLFANKQDLRQFALDRGLGWVEDSSNQSDKYSRNYLRHQVIPLVERLYPGVLGNLGDNIVRFRDAEALYRQAVDRHKGKLMERKGEEIHIPVLKLKRTEPVRTLIYEIIREFSFSPRQVDEVLRLMDSESGRYVLSDTHRILKNRNWLIISPHPSAAAVNILIETGETSVIYEGGELILSRIAVKEQEGKQAGSEVQERGATEERNTGEGGGERVDAGKKSWEQSPDIAMLDAAAVQFPLLLRKWRPGDYFYPLGMRKKKKLGRFFIDHKLSRGDKEKRWVIEMDKKIIWVVGMRIDDRHRITAGTHEILKIEMRLS